MQDPILTPRKTPRQSRSAATVDVILQAATRVLAEESLAGFNTNRIAEVAGVSVGSVYQYFPNKAALVARLIERTQESLADAIERHVMQSGKEPLLAVLAGMADIAIDHQFVNPVLAAALDAEERRLPVADVLANAQQRLVASIQTLFIEQGVTVGEVSAETAAIDCILIVKSIVESEAGRPQPNIPALRERVVRALQGYLQQPS
jgi:AcrR family transcriptional regulator